jgi:hypothetical protein
MSNKITKEELNKEYLRKKIKINTERNDIEKRIRVNNTALNDLRNNKQESVYRTKQLDKCEKNEERYIDRLQKIEIELDQIIGHNLDEEI